MEVIINPKQYQHNYIQYLNQCFTGWGNIKNYEWTFDQDFDLRKADFFIIKDNDNVIAGSALTYRRINVPNGKSYIHGTMTGSWTLPEARGKGCFSIMIQESKHLINKHSYGFLTAYVTESNASFRRLEAAGSYLIPTNYIVCSLPEIKDIDTGFEIVEDEGIYEIIYKLRNEQVRNNVHYSYTYEQFVSQFINRAEGKSKILSSNGEYCILSETDTTFRILFSTSYQFIFLERLRVWAGCQNKNIFFFTTKIIEKIMNNESYKIIPGYLTLLSDNEEYQREMVEILKHNHFHIEYGDKMQE